MRQNTPRRPPGKTDANAIGTAGRLSVGAGDHLDLGMTVSVYCAETARRQLAANAADGTSLPPDFIEH
jgi:hypothetical protein